MGLNLTYNDGQTPLDEDEKEGLLIKSISTRGELDEFEQQNIEDAIQWSLTRKFKRRLETNAFFFNFVAMKRFWAIMIMIFAMSFAIL